MAGSEQRARMAVDSLQCRDRYRSVGRVFEEQADGRQRVARADSATKGQGERSGSGGGRLRDSGHGPAQHAQQGSSVSERRRGGRGSRSTEVPSPRLPLRARQGSHEDGEINGSSAQLRCLWHMQTLTPDSVRENSRYPGPTALRNSVRESSRYPGPTALRNALRDPWGTAMESTARSASSGGRSR
jgi:hypothetical protein